MRRENMDPSLFAQLHGEMATAKQKAVARTSLLPEAVQPHFNKLMDSIVEIEKEEYKSDLVPFEGHAKEMRLKAEEAMEKEFNQISRAQGVLKQAFEQEDKQTPPPNKHATFEA